MDMIHLCRHPFKADRNGFFAVIYNRKTAYIKFTTGVGMMMAGKMPTQGGFTLAELLTVVMIIGVMIGSATVAFYAVSRNTDVKTTAEMLKEDLRKV